MINIGVKTIRAVTLAQFTLDFLSFSNKLMSGHATPEEFSMIGAKIMGTATFLKATDTSSSQESTSRLEDDDVSVAFKKVAVPIIFAPIIENSSGVA
jgi:hypothetical protein